MRVSARLLLPALVLLASLVEAQDGGGGFQLPVQLIGFPVIIMAVRISNFMKKLAYAVNPRTYARRARRGVSGGALHALGGGAEPDAATVEKLLLGEFGARVCVYERVCAQYAQRALAAHGHNALLDWDTVFNRYKSAPAGEKQNYLLSVFLGDMVRSPSLCLSLGKRGRSCTAMEAAEKSLNHLNEYHPPSSTTTTTTTTTTTSTTRRPAPRRPKPHTRVQHHQDDHRPASAHLSEHRSVEHHTVVHSPAPSSHDRRSQKAHRAPARGAPAHRQPAHPGAHAPANHRVDEHHVEALRKADHPAQVPRRARPARRHPVTRVHD